MKNTYSKEMGENLKKSTDKGTSGEKVFVPALRSILTSVPERSRDILEARFGITHHHPKTLEEIGKEYNITRERVRQIICSALHVLVRHHEEQSTGGHIENLIHTLLQDHSGIMKAETLLDELSRGDKEERGALTAFLECLPYARGEKASHEHGKIYFLDGFSHIEWRKIKNEAKNILEKAGTPLEKKEFSQKARVVLGDSFDEKVFFDYLAVSQEIGSNVFSKWGLSSWSDIKPRGTREKAFMILKNGGKPMHFRDIAEAIDAAGLHTKRSKSHPQTVHNELIKDTRFVLVGRGIYALSDWGYTAGTVKEVIQNILMQAGRAMPKQEILEKVLHVRQVKTTTIAINLNTFFAKDEKGLYSLKK
jgi:DNA-directed RNA polymerase delta subunit